MTDCSKVQTEVYTYLDGEATLWRRARVWWHLRRCPPCTDGFSFERRLQVKIRTDCTDEMPEELRERLFAFLKQEKEHGTG